MSFLMKYVIGKFLLVFLFVVMITLSLNAQGNPIVDSLFIIASSAEVMHQDAREPAMDSIATYGTQVVPFLVEKLNAISRQEKWTALWVLERIGAPSIPFLLDKLSSTDGLHVQRVCWALSRVGDSTAVTALTQVMKHTRWQVREEALGALGKIGDNRADQVVVSALSDSIGQVRKGAAVAVGQLLPKEGVDPMIKMLADDFYGARMSAFEALSNFDSTVILESLTPLLPEMNGLAMNLACQLLARTGTFQAKTMLRKLSLLPDPKIRSYASIALVQADPENKLGYHQQLIDNETDRLNLLKLKSAISSLADEHQ